MRSHKTSKCWWGMAAALVTVVSPVAVRPAHAAPNDTTLVSRASGFDGPAAEGHSYTPSSSADGRFIAFTSEAENLSEADNNAYTNVYVRDLQAGTTTLVSRAHDGSAADGNSSNPAISADGRFVAYVSVAGNLSTEDSDACPDEWRDPGPCPDVFVRDLQTGATTYVSRANGAPGAAADGGSYTPSISGDGRFVAFSSEADNLSADDANECYTEFLPYRCANVFVRDLQTGVTTYVAPGSGQGRATRPRAVSISADGRFVAFDSEAEDLMPTDYNSASDVFVHDLRTSATTAANRTDFTTPWRGYESVAPAISADGRFVAFESYPSGWGAEEGHPSGIWVRDLQSDALTYASRANGASGAPANAGSFEPSISADGRFVAFGSYADNLSAADGDGFADVFVRDLQTSATTYVSRASGTDGPGANGTYSGGGSISADARFVAFWSDANNLSTQDNDSYANPDVFVRELGPPTEPPTVADLSLSMAVSNAAPVAGTDVTFTLTLANAGPAEATGVAVADQLPAGLTLLSASVTKGTFAPESGLWSVGSIARGTGATLQIVARVASAGATTNAAQLTAVDQGDPDSVPDNNSPGEDDQASVTVNALPACPTATTVADADTWIGQNSASANHGTETVLRVRSKTYANARALVHFTLPTVPSGCKVTSVKLRLYATSAAPNRTLRAVALASPWTETAVAWRNQPATTGIASSATSRSGWVEWTVTTQVNTMYSGANNGFLIRDATEGGLSFEQRYLSRESGPDNAPQLIVTFGPA